MTMLRRIRPGLYRTADERYEVSYEEWWLAGECECALCRQGSNYACPNDGFGKRSGWTAYDTVERVHVIGEPFAFDTYREARDYLAWHLDRETAAMREP